jgi:hypothetical protein
MQDNMNFMDIMVPAEDGHWVNEKFARIAEVIQDYDPRMRLVWIPPENRTDQDQTPPYAVIYTNGQGQEHLVFSIREEELDERVLARLFQGDTGKHDVLADIEAQEKAREVLAYKAKLEKAEERQDFIKTVVGSGKHSFKHNGRVIPT